MLRNRGIDPTDEAAREAFLHPSWDTLERSDPMAFPDMAKAVGLIGEALAAKRLICVYGDYDVDGVCATSLLLLQLRRMEADVMFRIPKREEGYGMNCAAMQELAARGVGLLITVDCGITNVEEVRLARRLGMTVIITDHHELGETLPPADAILNPKLGYPFPHLCGAGVALKLSQALGGMEAVRELIDLAAIATVADMVMLTEENRAIVRLGLKQADHTVRPGLRMLKLLAQVKERMTSEDVSFRIGPRINAGGRLEDAAQCVRMLTEDGPEAEEIARHLNDLNGKRQQEQADMLLQAQSAAAEWDFHRHRVLIVSREGWNKGIIGLTAGRLCEQYHFPVIVLSNDPETGESVGSCRSIEGVHLHAVLTECAKRYREYNGAELFVRFGGHAMAAGLTIRTELTDILLELMDRVIGEERFCPELSCYIPEEEYDCSVPLQEVTLDMADELELLEPTGYGNPAPVFRAEARVESMRRCGRDGGTLQLSLMDGGTARRGVAFHMGQLADEPWQDVDVLFVPARNEFRGTVSVQLQYRSVRAAEHSVSLPPDKALFESLLQEIVTLSQNNNRIPEEPLPSVTVAGLKKMARDAAGRGLLLLGRERNRLLEAAALGCDLCCGAVRDRRGFSTLLCQPEPERLEDWWDTVVLLDGQLLPGEAERIRQRCPGARLLALTPNPALRQALADMAALDRAAVGRLYTAVRKHVPPTPQALTEATGLTLPQVLAAAAALSWAELVRYQPQPAAHQLPELNLTALPPPTQKLGEAQSPVNSPVLRYLRALPGEIAP